MLTTFYRVSYPAAIDALLVLLGRVNIEVPGIAHEFVLDALEMVRPSKRVSMADALLWAQVRSLTVEREVVTFDLKLPDRDITVRHL